MRTALHTIALAIWDASFITAAALILWHNAGDLVTTGALVGQLGCFVTLTTGVTVHKLLLRIFAARSGNEPRIITGVQFAHVAILATAALGWFLTQNYFVGWIVTFAAFVSAVAAAWQLLTATVTSAPASAPATATASRASARRRALAPWPFALNAALSVVVLAALTPIHAWNLGIINPIAVQASGSLLLGILIASWLTRRPAHRPGPAAA